MPPVTLHPPGLRARVRLDPSRWADPWSAEVAAGTAWARSRWPVLYRDEAALRELARRKQRPLDRELGLALAERNRALGASAASLAHVELLRAGEAVASIAGQQPAPLGGPLYALHKGATAVALARRLSSRLGTRCVPIYWLASEDSDFAEIKSATFSDRHLVLHEASLAEEFREEGGLVGAIPSQALARVEKEAQEAWGELPGGVETMALLQRSRSRGRDLGEVYAALLLQLFPEDGLVVVDPRWPAFRAAARPLYHRYLDQAADLTRAANAAGDELERGGGRRALSPAALESWLFAVRDGGRHKVSVDEARHDIDRGMLSPSVALRPIAQDGLFPTVAMAVGPGEIAYLAQLREAFQSLEVEAAAPVPRFSATWLPPAGCRLLEETGADPWDLVVAADSLVRRLAEGRLPPEVLREIRSLRRRTSEALESFSGLCARVDASLPQLAESVRGKVDFQLGRLEDGLVGKVRTHLERERPELQRLRYYLLPGDKLQERRLASLEPFAYRGLRAGSEVVELALSHLDELDRGSHSHVMLEL